MLDLEFLKVCESSSDEEVKKLPSVIRQTLEFLSSLSSETTITITDMKFFEELLNKDYYKGIIQYWKEIEKESSFYGKVCI